MVRYSVTSGPASEPLTATEAKTHLRVEVTDDDTYISTLIIAARKWAEEMGNLCLINQTIAEKFDGFPSNGGYFELSKSPVSSISSISYVDDNGDTQVWSSANYQTDLVSKPARIMPAPSGTYPSYRSQLNTVTVTYVAGFGATSANVPEPIRQAMLLFIGELYENRENKSAGVFNQKRGIAEKLLDNYRVKQF